MLSDKGTSTLTIENVTLEDAGQYVCTSRNLLGESHTKTMLHITRKYPANFETCVICQFIQKNHSMLFSILNEESSTKKYIAFRNPA